MITDNPVRDAELYMMEQPEIIGYCPFCEEAVTAEDEKIYGNKDHVAHRECVQKAYEEGLEFFLRL